MEQETKTIELSNRLFKLAVLLIIGIIVSYLGALVYQFKSLPQSYPREITVSGEGKAYAKPDVAIIRLGMHTQGFKSEEVVNKNNKIMNEVIRAAKDSGVEEKDIQTALYNLTPLYDYTETGRVFKGYSLDQQAQVKIRNFEKISDILDKASSAGANTIGDLQFTVDDMEKARAEARAKAIEQARQKASAIAEQTGLRIDKVVNVYEGYSPLPMPCGYGGDCADVSLKESVVPQIEPGQMEVSTTVTLTYRIR